MAGQDLLTESIVPGIEGSQWVTLGKSPPASGPYQHDRLVTSPESQWLKSAKAGPQSHCTSTRAGSGHQAEALHGEGPHTH